MSTICPSSRASSSPSRLIWMSNSPMRDCFSCRILAKVDWRFSIWRFNPCIVLDILSSFPIPSIPCLSLRIASHRLWQRFLSDGRRLLAPGTMTGAGEIAITDSCPVSGVGKPTLPGGGAPSAVKSAFCCARVWTLGGSVRTGCVMLDALTVWVDAALCCSCGRALRPGIRWSLRASRI